MVSIEVAIACRKEWQLPALATPDSRMYLPTIRLTSSSPSGPVDPVREDLRGEILDQELAAK